MKPVSNQLCFICSKSPYSCPTILIDLDINQLSHAWVKLGQRSRVLDRTYVTYRILLLSNELSTELKTAIKLVSLDLKIFYPKDICHLNLLK